MKYVARLVLVAMMGAAAVACSSNAEKGGPVESTAANAGRVVDDSVITGKVKAALVADPAPKAHEISVETFKGVVQLSGFVASPASVTKAAEVARNVGGVKSVKNDIRIK